MPATATTAPFNRTAGNGIPLFPFSYEKNLERLLAVATADGIELKNVLGDDNCAYHAVVDALEHQHNVLIGWTDLCRRVGNRLRVMKAAGQIMMLSSGLWTDQEFEEYVARVERAEFPPGCGTSLEYVDEQAFVAMSIELQMILLLLELAEAEKTDVPAPAGSRQPAILPVTESPRAEAPKVKPSKVSRTVVQEQMGVAELQQEIADRVVVVNNMEQMVKDADDAVHKRRLTSKLEKLKAELVTCQMKLAEAPRAPPSPKQKAAATSDSSAAPTATPTSKSPAGPGPAPRLPTAVAKQPALSSSQDDPSSLLCPSSSPAQTRRVRPRGTRGVFSSRPWDKNLN